MVLGSLFGKDGLDLFGQGAQEKANKANLQQLKNILNELGYGPDADPYSAYAQTTALYGDAAQGLKNLTGSAFRTIGRGRSVGQATFKESIAALEAGFAQGQQGLQDSIAATIESQVAMQKQAMAAAAQQGMGSGLRGTPQGAQMRGLIADATRSSSQAFADLASQRGALGAQQGQMMGQAYQQFGQDQMASYAQQAQLQQNLGTQLAQLYSNQAQAYTDIAALRADARSGYQHKAGPSPLSQIGQLAGGIGAMAIGFGGLGGAGAAGAAAGAAGA